MKVMQRSIKPEVGPRVMLPHGEKSNYCQSQENMCDVSNAGLGKTCSQSKRGKRVTSFKRSCVREGM